MKILGIDPGTIRMGVGLLEFDGRDVKLEIAETIKTHPKDPLPKRLKELYHALSEIFQAAAMLLFLLTSTEPQS